MVFLSPRWSKERYVYFYENEYDSYYRPTEQSDVKEGSKYTDIKEICARLEDLDLLIKRKSVLDIGAGRGWSLEWLKKNYPDIKELAAIEPSKQCIANLKEVIGAEVVATDGDDEWSSSSFDLIIMRHVLEHFLDPLAVLSKVEEHLSPRGVAYIAVPNMMSPKGSLKNYWFRTVHTYYFSEMTLSRIGSMAGLSPIEIRSNGTEIWGIFTRSSNVAGKEEIVNVYEKQMRVIRSHQRKSSVVDVIHKIVQLLSSS